jgi:hypothetical protein
MGVVDVKETVIPTQDRQQHRLPQYQDRSQLSNLDKNTEGTLAITALMPQGLVTKTLRGFKNNDARYGAR